MSARFFIIPPSMYRPFHIGITYWYRRGWAVDEDVFTGDGMPNTHELTIGLLLCRLGVEVETSIPTEE